MTESLDQLRAGLRQAATGVQDTDLLPGALQRSASRRRRRRAVAAGVTAVALVAGGLTATRLADRGPDVTRPAVPSTPPLVPPIAPFTPPPTTQQRPTTSAPRSSASQRSQSEADARRDRVPPDVAVLPLASRVDPMKSVVTASGRWVISRIPEPVAQQMVDAQMHHPWPTGLLGQDYVSPLEYGELLLMDPAGTRILRAFPLHALIPHGLLVTDSAVYVTRTATRTGADAIDQMVGRLDLRTGTWRVRITGGRVNSPFYPSHHGIYVAPGWVVAGPGFVAEDNTHGALTLTESVGGATVRFDPVTLGIISVQGGHGVPR